MILAQGWVDVRWYRPEHLPGLRAVHAACYPHEEWTVEDFAAFADRPGRVVKSITLGERVIGSLLYRMTDDAVSVARLGVLPEYRRKGVATKALLSLVGSTSLNRRSACYIKLGELNKAAVELVTKVGFLHIDTHENGREVVFRVAGCPPVSMYEDVLLFAVKRKEPTRKRRLFAKRALMP